VGDWLRHIVRFVVSALVLMFIGLIVPGFSTLSFWNALLAAVVIAGVGYLIEAAIGRNVSPFGRGGCGVSGGGCRYLCYAVRRPNDESHSLRRLDRCVYHWAH